MKQLGRIGLCLMMASWTLADNPILTGADPHAALINGTVYIYPTAGPRGRFYVYSSSDLATWQGHGPILDYNQIDWIPPRKSGWAPAIIEKDRTFYFYYSVGPKPSHIGVAVGTSPTGPFTDSGRALLSDDGDPNFEAIDPMVFRDPNSGRFYLYAGGSAGARLRVFELTDDMAGLRKEIPVQTPPEFTEGVFMHYHNGTYYLSYSHGGWRDSSYSVHYALAKTPTGPWDYRGAILIGNDTFKGPGHHSILYNPSANQWYIFYHRWENVKGDGPYRGQRKIAVDSLEYEPDGRIKPVLMTSKGPEPISFKPESSEQ
jgi:beta-xylosidase